MEDREEFESGHVLAQQPLAHQKLRVKLDKGFEDETYCVYVEYDGLAEAKGVRAASQAANGYAFTETATGEICRLRARKHLLVLDIESEKFRLFSS
jgi:hypothetical protein